MLKHAMLAGMFVLLSATTIWAQNPNPTIRSVPEPSSLIMLLGGLGGLGGVSLVRKRR
jgi:hypothetical protein